MNREIKALVKTAGVVVALGVVLVGPTACNNKPKAQAGTANTARAPQASTLSGNDEAVALYRRGQYAQAFAAATARAKTAEGAEKERLSLVAGLSAQAQDRNTEAAYWLKPLTASKDDEIAGRAAAGLGLIQAEEGRHAEAATSLSAAAAKLDGDDAAKAQFYLGESYAAMGKTVESTNAYRAASQSSDSRLRRLAQERLSLRAFAIQIGAYRDAAKARSAASSGAARARAAGLAPPRVVPRSLPDGRSVYSVQVGSYREMSRAQADKARLGGDAVIIRTAG